MRHCGKNWFRVASNGLECLLSCLATLDVHSQRPKDNGPSSDGIERISFAGKGTNAPDTSSSLCPSNEITLVSTRSSSTGEVQLVRNLTN